MILIGLRSSYFFMSTMVTVSIAPNAVRQASEQKELDSLSESGRLECFCTSIVTTFLSIEQETC